jgi:drug/metabolite transporter (DMT)-like permease
MGNNKPLQAHLSLLAAEIFWGLMAPIGKDAMLHGIDNISLVSFRVAGAAILFWITSIFVRENIPWKHVFYLAGAALLGVVFNQCLFTFGLSFTSPINSSIVTTSMPIFAMILSFFILKEPITWMKAGGVAIGCAGAIFLILSSAQSGGKSGNIWGDLMCVGAQFSFALYLALYNPLIKKYNVVTINKWMFTWSSIFILPFTSVHVANLPLTAIVSKTWLEAGFVVVFGTFLSYLLAVVGQRILRPTVVSVYNYVQPIVSVAVSVATGLGVFTFRHAIAIILVFTGVWMVIKSKSKRDLQKEPVKQ